MSKLEVRPVRLDDAAIVAGLITELGYPTGLQAMASRLTAILADPDYATFVAEHEGAVVGLAGAAVDWFYERDGRYGRLLVLVVSAADRGATGTTPTASTNVAAMPALASASSRH